MSRSMRTMRWVRAILPASSLKYAARSLGRHFRRTILSVIGIGVGIGVCLFMIGFVRGEGKMMIRAAAESGVGHVRVVPARWAETRESDLRIPGWRSVLDVARSLEGVAVATPRAHADALLAFGTGVRAVTIAGVDPSSEPAANRLVRRVAEGRYLRAGDRGVTVVGRAITRRLDVELDDELMVTLVGKGGDMRGAMLRIVGIVETGSREIDGTICQVTLEDLQEWTGRVGAGEVTLLVDDLDLIDDRAAALRGKVPDGLAVLTWREIMPEIASGVEVDETWNRLMVGIVMLVVFLGIASAQLAAVLERRREFAMLAAIGMRWSHRVAIMLVEGLVLGVLGGVLGLALGAPATWWVATHGIDFSAMWGDMDLTVSSILIDPVFLGDFGWWLVPVAFGLSLGAATLSSVYPAWFTLRIDPAAALRVDH